MFLFFLSQSNFEQLFEDQTLLLMCKSYKQTDNVTLTDVITILCTVRLQCTSLSFETADEIQFTLVSCIFI